MKSPLVLGNARIEMRTFFSASWKFVLIASLAFAVLASPTASADEATPADADAKRILGSWKLMHFEDKGKSDPNVAGGKLFVSPEEFGLYGFLPPHKHELDATQNPRHFNWKGLKGIYEIRGDWLRVCVPTLSDAPRPTEFKTADGDGRMLFVFKRLAALDPNAPDADFDAELKKTIADAAAALENGEVKTVMKALTPPQIFDEMPAAERENMEKYLSSQKEPYLRMFRALAKIKPEMNDTGDEATFDLTNCHIEGLSFPQIKFAKATGGWYVQQ